MNIVGVGSSIVECVRIGKMIERHGELFLKRVYNVREIGYCHSKKHVTEAFAGHWAAKRAIEECLGSGWRQSLCWTDIEVRKLGDGGPFKVYLCGAAKERAVALRIRDILVSMAHCRAYATAHAIALAE